MIDLSCDTDWVCVVGGANGAEKKRTFSNRIKTHLLHLSVTEYKCPCPPAEIALQSVDGHLHLLATVNAEMFHEKFLFIGTRRLK